jgi:hypothetical protein
VENETEIMQHVLKKAVSLLVTYVYEINFRGFFVFMYVNAGLAKVNDKT